MGGFSLDRVTHWKSKTFSSSGSHIFISCSRAEPHRTCIRLFEETLRYCIPWLWGFAWISDTFCTVSPWKRLKQCSASQPISWKPWTHFLSRASQGPVNGRFGILLSVCLLRLGTPPNCFLHLEFKNKCQSFACKTSLALDLLFILYSEIITLFDDLCFLQSHFF